jgi:hypothetical protein
MDVTFALPTSPSSTSTVRAVAKLLLRGLAYVLLYGALFVLLMWACLQVM